MKFIIINQFAPDLSRKVLEWAADLLLKNHLDGSCVVINKKDDYGEDAIPILVCESRQDLKKDGILCPYEFIIERHHLVPIVGENIDDAGELLTDPKEQLVNRLKGLSLKYPNGIPLASLRDWFAGLFRRYMFLDETVHGTSNLIDLDNLEKDEIILKACIRDYEGDNGLNAKKLVARFTEEETEVRDSLLAYKSLLKVLFSNEINEIGAALTQKDLNVLIAIYERCKDSYNKKKPLPYPRPLGDRAKFVTPSDKIDVLLIDDKPDEIDNRLDDLCKELFNIQKLKVDKTKKDVFETAREAFVSLQEKGLSFNLVLVDLCLGDESGRDLTGYRMIKFIRKHLPGIPIVVYSKFSDMDHIARAFICGARWFLVKGDESKLPRHVLRMLKQSGWALEWDAVKSGDDAPAFLPRDERNDFMRKLSKKDEWQYLIYKGLEFFPGHFITIGKIGEGISSSATFKAVKGVKLDGEYLQSPCIIKIDSAFNTAMEYERYFRMIRPYISNEAGRVEMPERVINRDNASIVYTFAGRQNSAHSIHSMGEMIKSVIQYESSCEYERFSFAFDMVFNEILPKIHCVTPNREFGEGEVFDLHSGAIDSPESKKAAFPNVLFNEFSDKDFYKGYLCRMQPWKQIELPETARFVKQPLYDAEIKNILSSDKDCNDYLWFTFHETLRVGNSYVLEVYDSEHRLLWIKGCLADHAARFRRLISPGKTLWIRGLDKNAIEEKDDREIWFKESMECEENGSKKTHDFNADICFFAGAEYKEKEDKFGFIKNFISLENDLILIAKEVGKVLGKSNKIFGCEFRSPIAIIHGDLNYSNIMLESRRHSISTDQLHEEWKISDAWFIDFARTRRDVIAHDFNVIFTATLKYLFDLELLADSNYKKILGSKFSTLVKNSFTSSSRDLNDIPDDISGVPRLVMIYKMLRRIRFAALDAGVSPHMYLLTSALTCAYTIKIFLNKKKYEAAAGLTVAMKICYDILLKDILDEDFKQKLNANFKWED